VGYYLNPNGESKLDFLKRVGVPLDVPEFPSEKDTLLVCLIENGPFNAAGIAYSREEMSAMVNDGTRRPRSWWWVPVEDAISAMSLEEIASLNKLRGTGQ
jgi:hypothetical protein